MRNRLLFVCFFKQKTSYYMRISDWSSGVCSSDPPEFRAGGDMWIPGVYDPVLDTFYIGTAQAKPWAAASRRMSSKDDALFTNSTLAIDPATGKMKWWFQHSPGDSLDMDDVFERVLVDDDGKKLLFTIGKIGRAHV